jgi:transcriptional regulator with GAF, ATPase, and Fis domain
MGNSSTSADSNGHEALQPTPASFHWNGPSSAKDNSQPDIEPLRAARRNATTAFEVKYLEDVLSRSQGSIARAAALSRVSRQMLQKLMRKHGLSMPR